MAISEISVSKIYVLATEPINKVKDRFWFDTTNNLLKRYDGIKWNTISVNTDDVKAVYPDHSTTTLSDYLSTLTSAIGDLNSNKQDKLKFYSELDDAPSNATLAADKIYVNASDLNLHGSVVNISSDHSPGIILNGEVSGKAIATSIPTESEASDNLLLSEKAIVTALDDKQDKLKFYSEVDGEGASTEVTISPYHTKIGGYSNQITLNAPDGIFINGSVSGNAILDSVSASDSLGGKLYTAQAVKDALDNKQNKLTAGSNINIASDNTISVSGLTKSSVGLDNVDNTSDANKPISTATQTALDAKQNKLNYYSEFGDEGDGQSHTSNFNAYNINIGVAQQQGYIKLDGYEITANGAFTGTAVSTSIPAIASASDTKLASEKAIATAIDTKQNNLVYYHENVSANQTALINGAKSFVIEGTVKGLVINSGYGGITIDSNDFSEGEAVISIANNSWMNHSDPILFDIDGDTIKISDALLIPEIKNKQNSTDNSLNTTDKTIVGAINELLASINANVITSTEQKRITTTSTSTGIQMSTTAKVCMVSINPVKTNVGAIYISTSSDTAPTINPLYPDQMPKYKFPDASQVYIWSDVTGDSVDLNIEYYG